MSKENYSKKILVNQSSAEVYQAINNIREWWSEDFRGDSRDLDDEFEVRFGTVHYSRQKLVEMTLNRKIAWLVTDSNLSFLQNTSEWTGTKISFELSTQDNQTEIHFTHHGLVPGIECYKDCSNGWNHYLLQSLLPYITSGHGNPNVLEKEIAGKSPIK